MEVQENCIQDIVPRGGDTMTVQSRISEYVERMGITQASICKKTGIRADTLSLIFANKRKMRADEFELICKALEKQPNDFMLVEEVEA